MSDLLPLEKGRKLKAFFEIYFFFLRMSLLMTVTATNYVIPLELIGFSSSLHQLDLHLLLTEEHSSDNLLHS